MQKVLIISYFFPPCNLTAANRVGSWEKHLPQNGFYPIVITRNWTGQEYTERERLKNSGKETRIENRKLSEIHYLPYLSSWRDRSFIKGQRNKFFLLISKSLTLFQLIFQTIFIKTIPYNNLYYHARDILKQNSDINHLIISANPFEQFFFGYLLKKEFPRLKWIADYRDDWTTNLLKKKPSFSLFFNKFNSFFEKKWCTSAYKITSISRLYCERLKKFHSKECFLIMNGFNENIYEIEPADKDNNLFQFTYSGTAYPNQDFRFILNAIEKLAKANPFKNFKITFLGSLDFIPLEQFNKLKESTLLNLEIKVTTRIDWEESISFLKGSDVLLLTSYGYLKGIPTSKLFEYLACETPIILSPSDNDIMEHIIQTTNTGVICATQEETYVACNHFLKSKEIERNQEEIAKYCMSFQVEKLSQLLD